MSGAPTRYNSFFNDRRKIKKYTGSQAVDHEKDIQHGRTTILTLLEDFRIAQSLIMNTLPRERVILQVQNSSKPEEQKLLLPSDFSPREQDEMQLQALSREERNFRVGGAHDALADIRNCIKSVGALLSRKQKQSRGQEQNTQAKLAIDNANAFRDAHMATYNAHRKALQALGYFTLAPDSETLYDFPELSIKDTYRKPTEKRRTPGDSHGVDGRLWGSGQPSTSRSLPPQGEYASDSDDSDEGTASFSLPLS